MNSRTITNFGGNQSFRPASVYAPRDEGELLAVLRECRGRRIRAIGRLHSWSEAPVADDVLIDLQHFREIRIEPRGDKTWVTAGAGCQIKRLLTELRCQANCTLPAHGLISEQTIAGVISTATHGSGQPSSSHFIDELRIATYDETGEPVIRTINSGDELQAARCSLGALGVIVSVGFWARPQYNIEEVFQEYADLSDVLAQELAFPRQQFYLIPWRWCYIAQHRRETIKPLGGWATLYRA
jgi:FAD/FMN-containing dehydrogenase